MQTKLFNIWSQTRFPLLAFVLLSIVVTIFCLFGIFSRPISHFAVFWPANAVLLGLLIRFPQLNNYGGILGAFSGFMLADLMTGNHLILTLGLTLSNFVSVYSALFLLHYIQRHIIFDDKTTAALVPYVVSVIFGGVCSALFAVCTVPYLPHTFMQEGKFWEDFLIWASGETLNYMIIMPICLAYTSHKKLLSAIHMIDIIPVSAITISVICTYVYFGPGALLYPLAALIWAASTYRLFTVAIINCVVCLTIYHGVGHRLIESNPYNIVDMIISIRIGLITLSLTTMMLCLTSQARHKMFKELHYLASHDSLTAALNRRSFVELSEQRLQNVKKGDIALIMLDIDLFKHLNDDYGHYAGDLVLKKFAEVIQTNIRQKDLFCRIGGEEFVIFMERISAKDALEFAERLRQLIANTKISVPNTTLSITVSMGIKTLVLPSQETLQNILNQADQALYLAKTEGRNQVRMAS